MKLNPKVFERAAKAFMLNEDGPRRKKLGQCGACYAIAGVLETERKPYYGYESPYHKFFNLIHEADLVYFGPYRLDLPFEDVREYYEARILALLWCAEMVRAGFSLKEQLNGQYVLYYKGKQVSE